MWVTSQVGAIVQVQDAASGVILFAGQVTNSCGKFYSSFFPPAPAPDAVIVSVTTLAPGFSPSSKTANVVDYVNIISASYSLECQNSDYPATSSDWYKHPTTPPILTAAGFGTLTFNVNGVASGTFPLTGVLPPVITVNSQLNRGTAGLPVLVPGGSDSAQTAIVQ